MSFNYRIRIIVIVIVAIMILSGISAIAEFQPETRGIQPMNATQTTLSSFEVYEKMILSEPFVQVPVSEGSVSPYSSVPYNGSASILVTFSLSNQSRLNSYLANLSDPKSPEYHKYITAEEFAANFSPSVSIYKNASKYFSLYPGLKVTSYADRISLQVQGPSKEIGKAFHTELSLLKQNSSIYYANSYPQLPETISSSVSGVSGFTNTPMNLSYNLLTDSAGSIQTPSYTQNGYIQPVMTPEGQYIYGSDLQVAYDENSFFFNGFPTNEVVATILWAGHNSTNNPVGPFDPSDIYAYYNATLPTGEPHSTVHGVPLNGAASPGSSASYDITGANIENTLDLEMIGSTAPGSSIYNVYGPNATTENIDASLAFILNPNSTMSALNNVSVITNSWGGPESNSSAWYEYLQEAQARGITVLASSGDSGDNANSSKYINNPQYSGDYVQFPAAMAYDNFGVTSVGGTTIYLGKNLNIIQQEAWYESSKYTGGNPAGSAGGISRIFSEPTWETNTAANNVLNGEGLGVPDIAAIANDTIIYITVNGTKFYGEEGYVLGGTSIASPIEAGIIAEIDSTLNSNNQPNLGYLNPMLFNLANDQFKDLGSTPSTGYIPTGNYNSTLPVLPFYNVDHGRNHVYNATFGYNLVTGWGSIDVYNLTMYLVNGNFSGSRGSLDGVKNVLALNALNVTTYLLNSTTNQYTTVNKLYNASIQQNFFIADESGAPIYWIQNVVYINGSESTGWSVNYTGWVVYPFFEEYPSSTVYEYNFPVSGKIIKLPYVFNIESWISNPGIDGSQIMNFEVNNHTLQIPVPGAAYIIGSYDYNYIWQGNIINNGPNGRDYLGGLDPQFGLVGGPSGGLGAFGNNTEGNISSYIMPMGMNTYIPASTQSYNYNETTTGEVSENLSYQKTSGESWSLGINDSSTQQGVFSYENTYKVEFNETGLKKGTEWSVNVDGLVKTTNTTYITMELPIGEYNVTLTVHNDTYISSVMPGNITVSDANLIENVAFYSLYHSVIFKESGLPGNTQWYVNITGAQSLESSVDNVSVEAGNGTFYYTVATPNKEYEAHGGSFTISGEPMTINVSFTLVRYPVKIIESGLPRSNGWFVNITGLPTSGEITSNSFSLSLPNGTYQYATSSINKSYTSSPGAFTVNGSSKTVNVYFSGKTYIIKFTENGLPSGNYWYVNITGGQLSGRITGSSYNLSLQNGTYNYSVSTSYKVFKPVYMNSFTVNGSSNSESISFTTVTYEVTLSETGLTVNTEWYVNLTGLKNSAQAPGSMIYYLSNGTYKFSITNLSIYYALSNTLTVMVDGSNITSSITYEHWAYLDGKVSPGNAKILLNGKNIPVVSGAFNISVEAGTYNLTASAIGYESFNSNFNISAGSLKNITIDLQTSSKSGSISNTDAYAIITGVVAVAIIGGAVFLVRRR